MTTATLTKADIFKAIGFTPTPYQREISEGTGERIIDWNRRTGKTTILAAEVVAALLTRPGIVCHGTDKHHSILFDTIVRFLQKAHEARLIATYKVNQTERRIFLDNGSRYETGRCIEYDFYVDDQGDVASLSDKPGRSSERHTQDE